MSAITAHKLPPQLTLFVGRRDELAEIARLLSSGLTTREVAQQLFLAVSTVKWYLNQIYSKLSVHSRIQAIAHARDLKLLA